MKPSILAVMALAVAVPAQGSALLGPIAPGLFCLKEAMTGYTGTAQEISARQLHYDSPSKQKGRSLRLSIANRMPDDPEILSAESNDARIYRDGSLAFPFTDGWENQGRARVYRNGRVALVMIKEAGTPMNQIGRNYGTYIVSQADCTAQEFRKRH
jgi:hypothetical protein